MGLTILSLCCSSVGGRDIRTDTQTHYAYSTHINTRILKINGPKCLNHVVRCFLYTVCVSAKGVVVGGWVEYRIEDHLESISEKSCRKYAIRRLNKKKVFLWANLYFLDYFPPLYICHLNVKCLIVHSYIVLLTQSVLIVIAISLMIN